MSSQQIYVSIELDDETFNVGKLWFHQRGARQSASFEYEPEWLKHAEKFALDPALQLTEGAFHTTPDQILFGAIGDSAPDRWGRVLMRRAESARAKSVGETTRTLSEVDYLLGVNDEARQHGFESRFLPKAPAQRSSPTQQAKQAGACGLQSLFCGYLFANVLALKAIKTVTIGKL